MEWKMKGNQDSVPKHKFQAKVKKVLTKIEGSAGESIRLGFKKWRIILINCQTAMK